MPVNWNRLLLMAIRVIFARPILGPLLKAEADIQYSEKKWENGWTPLSGAPVERIYPRWGPRRRLIDSLPVTLLAYCPLGSLAVAINAMNVLSERRGFKDTAVAIGLVDTRHLQGCVSR